MVENEEIEKAIKQEKKWMKLSHPLALIFTLLFIVLILLNQIILAIVVMVAVYPILMAIPSIKTSKLLGFRDIKRLDMHPEDRRVLRKKALKMILFSLTSCAFFILSSLSRGVESIIFSLAGLGSLFLLIPEMSAAARIVHELHVRMLPRDTQRWARKYFDIISPEKASTLPWERGWKRRIVRVRETSSLTVVRDSSLLPIQNLDNGKSYSTIQEAVEDPETKDGHTIIVRSGVYVGRVVITKSLNIRSASENPRDTVIVAERADEDVFYIASNRVSINGFTIKGGFNGIFLDNVENCIVSNNIITGNRYSGIQLSYSNNNVIVGNIIEGNIKDFGRGIHFYNSNNNIVLRNNVRWNRLSIVLDYSNNNRIFLNNFNNTKNVSPRKSVNTWSCEETIYTCKSGKFKNRLGNYWSDYKGEDKNKDEVIDTPRKINADGEDKDEYPLAKPFEEYLIEENSLNTAS